MKQYVFLTGLLCAAIIVISIPSCQEAAKQRAYAAREDSLKVQVERGKYLANSVVNCIDCHSQLDLDKFSLPVVPGTEGGGGLAMHEAFEGFPGTLFIPNITPASLGTWTDDEIARAITTGINKKGDTLFPMMPYHFLNQMAKEDVDAVIAYIRTLKPIEKIPPARNLAIPMSLFGPLPNNDYRKNVRPDTADKVKYGEYLVTIAHCAECHTTKTNEGMPRQDMLFAGGNTEPFKTFSVTTANITADSATGIGEWSELMFIAKFRTNAAPENLNTKPGKYNTYMPWSFYGTMTDNDLKAIYAYLRSVPHVRNAVVKWKE